MRGMTWETTRDARRGSALLVACIFSLAMASVVYYVLSGTDNTRRSAATQENRDQSLAAANYGVEVAMDALVSGIVTFEPGDDVNSDERGENSFVVRDWVLGADGNETGQRFIQGTLGDQEFRIRVRSARQTRIAAEKGLTDFNVDGGWLGRVSDFVFYDTGAPDHRAGKYKDYSDLYEITASAQSRTIAAGDATPAHLQALPAIQTVVDIRTDSFLGVIEKKRPMLGPDKPQYFSVTATSNPEFTFADNRLRGSNRYRPELNIYYSSAGCDFTDNPFVEMVSNVFLSGEDHSLNKYYMEDFDDDKIIPPLKLRTPEANYFGAYGGYWTNGCLTLNYQIDPTRPNPYRPKTRKLANTTDDRAMKILDSSREADTYLLGGKESRTVTIGQNGKINEYKSSGASNDPTVAKEGGNFNIVLGAFEDLMNLYINMAGITSSNSYPNDAAFADTNQWFRMYIGQYTESKRNSSVDSTSIPIYYGGRIRAQTLHVIKNKDGHVLVREYEKGGRYYNYAISGGTWTNNYTWADVVFGNPGKFWLKTDTGKTVTPRMFMWQELVGFQLQRRGDGHPKLNPDGTKRTMFELDEHGRKIPVGFDEQFQRNAAGNVNYTMEPRFDIINVRADNGVDLEPKGSMDDFLFEKDFGIDEGSGIRIKRDTLAIFIGYEDQREHQADYNYTDMMFTIYVAPQKRTVEDIATLGQAALQWWERDEEEGLTGRGAHVPLGSHNGLTDIDGLSKADIERENFDLLGWTGDKDILEENVFTMVNGDTLSFFPRAYFQFGEDYGDNHGRLDIEHPRMVDLWNNDDVSKRVRNYFYVRSDVIDFMQVETEQYVDQINHTGWLMDLAVEKLQLQVAKDDNATIQSIEERWDDDEGQTRATFAPNNNTYMVIDDRYSARWMAGQIIGTGKSSMPSAYTENFSPLSDKDPEMRGVGLLAGEMIPAAANGTYEPLDHGLLDSGMRVPHLATPWTMPELEEDGTVRKAYTLDYTADTAAEAVAKCYVEYYHDDPHMLDEVQELYGYKENRYSIGFHRSGTSERFKERYGQDHLEVVSLGVSGFNPYRMTDNSPYYLAINDQKIEDDEKSLYKVGYKYAKDETPGISRYAGSHDGAGVPNFIFDKPIDGGGKLVVNGNLIVRDTFAYYGVLVVLGDVVVIPTLKEDQYVYGPDGFPMDEYGHSLRLDGGGWYYTWKDLDNPTHTKKTYIVLDVEGEPVIVGEEEGEDINTPDFGQPKKPDPLKEKCYRGELTVQGTLVVGGRVLTETVHNEITECSTTGKLTAIWSLEAVSTPSLPTQPMASSSRQSWSLDSGVDITPLWKQ